MINLDTTIVNVALPTLVPRTPRHNSAAAVDRRRLQPRLRRAAAASGSLSDRLGRKGMLLAGCWCSGSRQRPRRLSPRTRAELIAARCLMGLGAAMVFPSTLSLISNVFTERAERARSIGLWGATAGIAIALGPIVGGWLLGHFSWASIFFALAPVSLAARPSSRASCRRPANPASARPTGPASCCRRLHGAARLHDHRGPGLRLDVRSVARLRAAARSCWPRSSSGSAAPADPMLDVRAVREPALHRRLRRGDRLVLHPVSGSSS